MPHTKEIISRNSLIVDDELQEKISNTRLAFIGCGLGSNIATLAARTGFVNLLLADGDTVDESNLNRQEYVAEDIGKNKAAQLSKKLLSINLDAKVEIKEYYINKLKEIDDIAKWADVIINTADFTKGFYKINEAASRHLKLSIVPFNVGYGSVITVFGKQNEGLMINALDENSSDGDHFIALLKHSKEFVLPQYFLPVFSHITNKEKTMDFIPQIGMAANVSAANVLTIIIKHLLAESIPYFPRVSHIDLKDV